MNALHNFCFVALPYVALFVFVIGSIHRYLSSGFKYSSLSAQFLCGDAGFWGTVPFHFGILIVFIGHLAAFLFPASLIAWNGSPVRLLILEVSGLACALSLLIGITSLFIRRITTPRLQVVTNRMDMVIEALIIIQVILGIWIAVNHRWGSSWFASSLSPYLWSIFKLNPQAEVMAVLPHVVQAHVVLAFVIVLLIPFTRLVHFLVMPLHYIARPYQYVIWNWDRKTVRDPRTVWTQHRPKNN